MRHVVSVKRKWITSGLERLDSCNVWELSGRKKEEVKNDKEEEKGNSESKEGAAGGKGPKYISTVPPSSGKREPTAAPPGPPAVSNDVDAARARFLSRVKAKRTKKR